MRRIYRCVIVIIAMNLLFAARGFSLSSSVDLPQFDGKPVLAWINGEPLFLEEFERALAGIHDEVADNTTRSLPKPVQLLDRLINSKLISQEARNIGLDELPEVRSAQKVFEEDTLRGMLYRKHVRNIKTPDKKEVEKRYREAVKEVRVISVLFDKEEYAKRLESEVKAGGSFEDLARESIAAGEAKGSTEGQYLKFGSLNPEVATVVFSMKKGEVSSLLRIGKQFSLLKLEDIRYPDDKAARSQAKKEALQAKKTEVFRAYTEGLTKKYVKVDRMLFDNLDFESSEPGIEKFRSDERTVVTVRGGKPVTVGDLTKNIEKKFFHGAKQAVEGKKINRLKDQVLEEILNKQVTLLEAKKQKLDRTENFKAMAQDNRNGVLFGAFMRKVIAPEVKLGNEELNGYYQTHIAEYTYPEMVRIDGLAFSDKATAEDAIEKLRKGADYQWLQANAEGQVDMGKNEDLLLFKGEMLLVPMTLPEGVRKAIAGAVQGDYRLYADPGRVYYVLRLLERIPSRPIPLESVKGELEKKVFNENLQRILRDWEEKLRKASDVKIYATGKKLDRIVNPDTR